MVQFYGIGNSRVLESPYTPSPSFLAYQTLNNAEISTGGGQIPILSSNTNIIAATATSTCKNTMAASMLLPNLKVNNYTLSMGGGGNKTVPPNKNTMATPQNMPTYTCHTLSTTQIATRLIHLLWYNTRLNPVGASQCKVYHCQTWCNTKDRLIPAAGYVII